jgi:phenylalanyl-tRNA synthetase beta chain
VRRAREGEHITTLDGQDRALTPSILLIADPRRGIGIAGVMGGANAEVTGATSRVFLESAYFLPGSIRRTARALALPSDAAYRFERGADIEGLVDASDRAAQLMAELAGGKVARGVIDIYPSPRPRPRVHLRMDRVRRVLGVAPGREHAVRILRGLGLDVRERDGEALEAEIPTFRRDLTIEDDLVEEIIRVWGYDKIPSTLPAGAISLVQVPVSRRQAEAARRALVGAGLDEVITYSFTDASHASAWLGTPEFGSRAPGSAGASVPALTNPLSQDASLLRRHPLEGVLRTIATNLRRQQSSVPVFEITKTYGLVGSTAIEPRWVAIGMTGVRTTPAWYAGAESVDVYDIKGLASHVLRALGVGDGRDVAPADTAGSYEPDVRGALVAGPADGRVVAEYGEVAASVRGRFDIEVPVFGAVISLDAVAALPQAPIRYQPLPRFPSVQRDVAFVMPAGDEPRAGEVEAAIRAEAGPLLRHLMLFDLFRLPDGRRSLAWRLTFQADDRTLTDEEVNTINERVAARVSQQFGITRRGGNG